MKIIVHIGTFKTGSTALQHHFSKNKQYLWERGYYYGDYFDTIKAHSNLAYGLLKEALVKYGIYNKYSLHPRFTNVAEKPKDVLERMFTNASGRGILISSEALYADSYRTLIGLNADQEVRKYDDLINEYIRCTLYQLLSQYSNDITVVCYLRRQDLWIESQYNQVRKTPWHTGNQPVDFADFVKADPIHLDYEKELLEWGKMFGNENIIIKGYEEPLLSYGLIRDFYESILQVNDFELTTDVERKETNAGLDSLIVEYLKKLDKYDKRLVDIFLGMGNETERYNRHDGFFDENERKDYLKNFETCNKNTARIFLGREKLFMEEYRDIKKTEEIGYEDFVRITRELLEAMLDE